VRSLAGGRGGEAVRKGKGVRTNILQSGEKGRRITKHTHQKNGGVISMPLLLLTTSGKEKGKMGGKKSPGKGLERVKRGT